MSSRPPISTKRGCSCALHCTSAPISTPQSSGRCTPSSNVVYTDGWRVFLRPRLKAEAPTPAASPPTANKANIPIDGIAHDLEPSSVFNTTLCSLEYSRYAAVEHGAGALVGGSVGHGVVVGQGVVVGGGGVVVGHGVVVGQGVVVGGGVVVTIRQQNLIEQPMAPVHTASSGLSIETNGIGQ